MSLPIDTPTRNISPISPSSHDNHDAFEARNSPDLPDSKIAVTPSSVSDSRGKKRRIPAASTRNVRDRPKLRRFDQSEAGAEEGDVIELVAPVESVERVSSGLNLDAQLNPTTSSSPETDPAIALTPQRHIRTYAHHRLLLSNSIDVSEKKRAIDVFRNAGGTIVRNMSDVTMLCIRDGGLKKTAKFILAVALGRHIVTDRWLDQSSVEVVYWIHQRLSPEIQRGNRSGASTYEMPWIEVDGDWQASSEGRRCISPRL